MLGYIWAIVGEAGNSVRSLANATARRIQAVWDNTTGFLGRVRTGVIATVAGVVAYVAAHVAHALAVATTLAWLVRTLVPAAIAQLRQQLLDWAIRSIAAAEARVSGAVDALRRWASAQLLAVAQALADLRGWALRTVAGLLADVAAIKARVFGVLANATRLVDWILPTLLSAVGHWVLDNAVGIGRKAWAARDRWAVTVLHLLEDIFAAVL